MYFSGCCCSACVWNFLTIALREEKVPLLFTEYEIETERLKQQPKVKLQSRLVRRRLPLCGAKLKCYHSAEKKGKFLPRSKTKAIWWHKKAAKWSRFSTGIIKKIESGRQYRKDCSPPTAMLLTLLSHWNGEWNSLINWVCVEHM